MRKSVPSIVLAAILALFSAAASVQTPLAAAATPSTVGAPATEQNIESLPAVPAAPMPSWFEGDQPNDDARVALAVLADAQSQGLRPQDYRASELAQAFERPSQSASAPGGQAKLGTGLTSALEHYLTDLVHGRLSPEVLKHRFKAPPLSQFNAHAYVLQARQSGRLAQALGEAQPKVPMYESLRRAMSAYRALGDPAAWHTPLPPLPTRSLRPGQAYAGLAIIAERLAILGDLPTSEVATEHYEGGLVDAVRRFQERHGLEMDGVLGPATLAQLNVTPAQRVEQMALTLERLRWTPLLYAPRMIVVNIPEFVLRAYELQDNKVRLDLEMRVVVGKALDTRTPIFLEDMRFIEFSPYWNVPRSIALGETLPRLRRDPDYFVRQGFEFVTGQGKVVTALSSQAIDAVQRGEWRIRQRPGPQNAMGDIKFIFPNDQNIYLHYTSAPELFSRARRDFSHGCIRIETPVALAQFVLRQHPEWTRQRIVDAMGSGQSRTLRLDHPVPVLIAYSTVIVKGDGKVYFFPDIYHQDARLEQALGSARRGL
ncbi:MULTISPECIES: L,D-transpeptidase family protein [unclassified Castellaniella]|uniref:L,D-transpeptidase family protein n=2 Tax=Castellaniella TaxID=359336 RepID=UPI0033155CC9